MENAEKNKRIAELLDLIAYKESKISELNGDIWAANEELDELKAN
jgi:hypothetical protein